MPSLVRSVFETKQHTQEEKVLQGSAVLNCLWKNCGGQIKLPPMILGVWKKGEFKLLEDPYKDGHNAHIIRAPGVCSSCGLNVSITVATCRELSRRAADYAKENQPIASAI